MLDFFSVELKPAELEQRYRHDCLERNKSHALMTMFICILAIMLLTLGQLLLFPSGFVRDFVAGLNIATSAAWLVFALLIRRQNNPTTLDLFVTLWALTVVALILTTVSLRPEGFYVVPVWCVIGILIIYTALPLPIYIQSIVAMALTLGGCLVTLLTTFANSPPFLKWSTLTAFIVTNIIGFTVARAVKRSHRLTYTLLESERKSRLALEEAAAEIRTLQGIVPICANCKKVRDDEGLWNQVESYIEKHSDAMFSHSLCPQCNEDLYGDQPWFKRMKEKEQAASADHQTAKTP